MTFLGYVCAYENISLFFFWESKTANRSSSSLVLSSSNADLFLRPNPIAGPLEIGKKDILISNTTYFLYHFYTMNVLSLIYDLVAFEEWTLFSFNCIVNHFAAFLRWMVHIKSFVWLFAIAQMVHFLSDISKKDTFRLFTLSCNFLTLAILTLMWKEKCLYH